MVAMGLYVLLCAFTEDSEVFLLKSVSIWDQNWSSSSCKETTSALAIATTLGDLTGRSYMNSLSAIYKLMRPDMCKNPAMLRRDQEMFQNNPKNV